MAYVDLAATEARGRYSPPNGNDPQTIPDLWRPAPGEEIRTDLPDLTNEELNALGWKGPIVMPSNLGFFTHSYKWNNETRETMQPNYQSTKSRTESNIKNSGMT